MHLKRVFQEEVDTEESFVRVKMFILISSDKTTNVGLQAISYKVTSLVLKITHGICGILLFYKWKFGCKEQFKRRQWHFAMVSL